MAIRSIIRGLLGSVPEGYTGILLAQILTLHQTLDGILPSDAVVYTGPNGITYALVPLDDWLLGTGDAIDRFWGRIAPWQCKVIASPIRLDFLIESSKQLIDLGFWPAEQEEIQAFALLLRSKIEESVFLAFHGESAQGDTVGTLWIADQISALPI